MKDFWVPDTFFVGAYDVQYQSENNQGMVKIEPNGEVQAEQKPNCVI